MDETYPPDNYTRLFVYGTLKRGFCRHGALETERFLGTAQTAYRYRMVNVGSYPALIEVFQGGRSIHGEVWEVSPTALRRLDEVEGTDEGQYERRPIEVQGWEYEGVQAYFYMWPTDDCPDCGDRWEDG
ncbi:gamma-glutamylcyclotransferase family protein [Planctomicrobium piriforme]|uniref:Gamma-glutamylcyclotransferase family protein n=1 Tax=Planctomicrobium piriforme TaxID=1576369 RepID=A0A1I3M516_9PLAN|nr:gamma-glutamylcyclotransferase family protein [Planctomicrobium piriforme]SFI91835.1 Uncharacterized conserved protein YtfP, gamma-glutamylcyclotransferase (GGCT)/AIG2-like family [Planctomicrobium piriforme]